MIMILKKLNFYKKKLDNKKKKKEKRKLIDKEYFNIFHLNKIIYIVIYIIKVGSELVQ